MTRRLYCLILCLLLLVVACDEEGETTPTPQPPQPTAIALNPPQVWIDQPLPGKAYLLENLPAEIVVHAASVGGNAQLEITVNGELWDTLDLGAPLETITDGGYMSRYQGEWLSAIQALVAESTGDVVIEIRVVVEDVASSPIILTILKETATPTATATDTVTPSSTPTDTPTDTPTPSDTPTDTPTPELSDTPTDTLTPTDTPTDEATATFTPTYTPTATDTPVPVVRFVPKDTEPCELVPARDQDVAARVGPGDNRASLTFIKPPKIYTVTGYNADSGSLWWEFDLTEANRKAWVADTLVYTRGSCMLVPYVEAPDIVRRPPPQRPTHGGGSVTPNGSSDPVIYFFYADHYLLPDAETETECTYVYWSVEFVDAVYLILNGTPEGVSGIANRYLCPTSAITVELAIYKNGAEVERQSFVIDYGTITVTREPRDPVINYFYADYYDLPAFVPSTESWTQCTYIYWDVSFTNNVVFEVNGDPINVEASGSYYFCPGYSSDLYLYVYKGGELYETRSMYISYMPPPALN